MKEDGRAPGEHTGLCAIKRKIVEKRNSTNFEMSRFERTCQEKLSLHRGKMGGW